MILIYEKKLLDIKKMCKASFFQTAKNIRAKFERGIFKNVQRMRGDDTVVLLNICINKRHHQSIIVSIILIVVFYDTIIVRK